MVTRNDSRFGHLVVPHWAGSQQTKNGKTAALLWSSLHLQVFWEEEETPEMKTGLFTSSYN